MSHAHHLGKLLDAALYNPLHEHLLVYQKISDVGALGIIRNSIRLARHYASLSPSDGAHLMFAVAKDPETGLNPACDDMGQIGRVDFSQSLVDNLILSRQRNGVGCSASILWSMDEREVGHEGYLTSIGTPW